MTDDERDEMISAAFDGESVDLGQLQAALATPEGRAAASEFLLLRATVAADKDMAPRVLTAGARDVPNVRATWQLFLAPRVPASIAASLILLASAGALWAGMSLGSQNARAIPGSPASSVVSSPTSAAPGVRPAATQPRSDAPPPPTPTRVLRFTPGLDWHEGS